MCPEGTTNNEAKDCIFNLQYWLCFPFYWSHSKFLLTILFLLIMAYNNVALKWKNELMNEKDIILFLWIWWIPWGLDITQKHFLKFNMNTGFTHVDEDEDVKSSFANESKEEELNKKWHFTSSNFDDHSENNIVNLKNYTSREMGFCNCHW